MKFSLTLTKQSIQQEYSKLISKAAETLTIKGFRQGKAPLNLVKERLDPAKLQEEVIRNLIPPHYNQYIKSHNLHPITNPHITITSTKDDADWEFEIEIAENPQVQLNHYKQAINKLPPPKKVKNAQDLDNKNTAESDQLNLILDTLYTVCQVTVPQLLIDQEVDHALSHIVNQTEKLGITVDQYLSSMQTTAEKLRSEYAVKAERNLKMEFILDEIASQEKLRADPKDFSDFLSKVKDKSSLESLKSHPEQQQSVLHTLTRQKVIAYLKSL